MCRPSAAFKQTEPGHWIVLNITIDPWQHVYAQSDKATTACLHRSDSLAVGLFEFMQRLRVHLVQYALVGAAMVLFFLCCWLACPSICRLVWLLCIFAQQPLLLTV
jgi:inner membrane protein involved in colicin E2 resistance